MVASPLPYEPCIEASNLLAGSPETVDRVDGSGTVQILIIGIQLIRLAVIHLVAAQCPAVCGGSAEYHVAMGNVAVVVFVFYRTLFSQIAPIKGLASHEQER